MEKSTAIDKEFILPLKDRLFLIRTLGEAIGALGVVRIQTAPLQSAQLQRLAELADSLEFAIDMLMLEKSEKAGACDQN